MRTWRTMDRAPHDGRWIIAINRDEPDQRAIIRWDPKRADDAAPWHVASCEHSYRTDAFTHWMQFPDCPPVDGRSVVRQVEGAYDGSESPRSPLPAS
ncbi:hypothetical protein ABIE45_001250 [Methylobacterium sp. OAE515]|jgi:hypothetical protein